MATLTLQDLVLAVSHALRDCLESTTTDNASTAITLRDTTLKQFSTRNGRYAGSDLLIKSGATGFSGANPRRIIGFDNTAGDLTFTGGNWGTGAAPAGTAYALLNVGGAGHPYTEILSALDLAFSALALKKPATDQQITLAADVNGLVSHDLTIPAGIDWLTSVTLTRTSPYTQLLAPSLRAVLPGTRTLRVRDSVCLNVGDVVTFSGLTTVARPVNLTDTVDVNREQVVNAALEYLLRDSKDRDEQTLMANLYGDRLRTGNTYRWPSSVKVG